MNELFALHPGNFSHIPNQIACQPLGFEQACDYVSACLANPWCTSALAVDVLRWVILALGHEATIRGTTVERVVDSTLPPLPCTLRVEGNLVVFRATVGGQDTYVDGRVDLSGFSWAMIGRDDITTASLHIWRDRLDQARMR